MFESNHDFERRIVRTFYKRAQHLLTPSQRKAYQAEIVAAASIAAARASGFGVYQMATTVMGMASNAAGITIPFIGYMALTKAIFLVIGPLGWAAIGVSTLHKISKPDYSKMITVIAWMFAVRNQIHPQRTIRNYSITEIVRMVIKFLGAAVPAILLITTAIHSKKPLLTSSPPAISKNLTQPNPVMVKTKLYQDATQQPRDLNYSSSANNGSQDEETAIMMIISGWASALAQNNSTMAASYYATKVDRYFLQRNVTREFVQADKRLFIERGKRLGSFSARDIQFQSSSPEAATVSLTKYWVVFDRGATKGIQGKTRSRLWLEQTPEGWKITGEQDLH